MAINHKKIDCPKRLDEINVSRLLNDCLEKSGDEEIIIDFRTLRFVSPGGVLSLAMGIKDFVEERRRKGLKTSVLGVKNPTNAVSYLAFVGFFDLINVPYGRKINNPPGTENYLPIHKVQKNDLEVGELRIQENIERYSEKLAKIIYPDSKDITKVDMLRYCMREVIRNVFEHAEVDECYVMAQRWGNGFAEIAIIDRGIGLAKSLSETHQIEDSKAAISMAIKPGVTRIVEPENNDVWQNSGFGLYVLSEVGQDYGAFSLATNGIMLNVKKNESQWFSLPITGTLVKLLVSTTESEYFANVIQQVVMKGESIAKDIKGARRTASSGSKSISKNIW